MARRRVAGYITKQSQTPRSTEDLRPGRVGWSNMERSQSNNFELDEVIPPGEIGSVEGKDTMEQPTLSIDTHPYDYMETRDQKFHGPVPSIGEVATPFQAYASFTPRTAPMPVACQDEGFLRIGNADPLMSDGNRTMPGMLDRTVYPKDLYGRNEAGASHNSGHPGFKAVQGKIEKEGYSKKAAGAILANATRHASKAAKKANPRLNRVK